MMEHKRNTIAEPGKIGTAEWLRREEERQRRRRDEQGEHADRQDVDKPANPTGIRTK